jgi:hypothetical protein
VNEARDHREASGAQQLRRALLRAVLHQAQHRFHKDGEGKVLAGEQASGCLPGRAQVCKVASSGHIQPAINPTKLLYYAKKV